MSLLMISTRYQPATDLGYLLHKHPDRNQVFELSCGRAQVYYPAAGADVCTAALLLDINPVELVRAYRGVGGPRLLAHYVNDRPYVASSFLSVAIAQVFGSALAGRCAQRPDLVDTPIPLEATLAALPCRGGEALLQRLFEPLGYSLDLVRHSLPGMESDSPYYSVTLKGVLRLQDLLRHLYVLIPVLDREKHYWVGDDEVDKLLRHGEDWLADHPERDLIARRYLKDKSSLTRMAIRRLTDESAEEAAETDTEAVLEAPLSLNEQRMQTVLAVLKTHQIRQVVDMGCGEGRLLGRLLKEPDFDEIIGLDVSSRSLEIAAQRLKLDRLSERQRQRIRLLHGSLIYRDSRIQNFAAATVVEVIEHLDLDRLDAFAKALFGYAKPGLIVMTTPNAEYNVKFAGMAPGQLRHRDHRFEWSRQQFQDWATKIGEQFAYAVTFQSIGEDDAQLGAPTQMAVFSGV